MTIGSTLRIQNKHRKIVLKYFPRRDEYLVRRTENILDPPVGSFLRRNSVQEFIDSGFTVVITEKTIDG